MIYIAVGVIVIVGIVAYLLLGSGSGSALVGQQVGQSTLMQLQQIANNNTLANQVGVGIVTTGANSNPPRKINARQLIVDGKPEVLYIGGDFCPYCAGTRWGLIIALMRFGNFSKLTYMQSSSTDSFPNTITFSFTNSSYHSNLVHFDGFEVYDRTDNPINNSNYTVLDQFLLGKYASGFPFIDFANTSIQDGAVISPQLLSGDSWQQAISALNNPNGVLSQSIIGSANLFTAYICMSNSTLNATASACRQSYIKTITR